MERLRLGGGGRQDGVPAVLCPWRGLLGTTVVVVEHGVPSSDLHVNAVAHRHRLEHLYHLFVGHSQHTNVIDVHQDVR